MTIERYEFLKNDHSVLKVNGLGAWRWGDASHNFAVWFAFSHSGEFGNGDQFPKRVLLSVLPFDRVNKDVLNEIHLDSSITDGTIILANADLQRFALAYQLSVDTLNKKVVAKLIDKPETGDSLITAEEYDGVEGSYDHELKSDFS